MFLLCIKCFRIVRFGTIGHLGLYVLTAAMGKGFEQENVLTELWERQDAAAATTTQKHVTAM